MFGTRPSQIKTLPVLSDLGPFQVQDVPMTCWERQKVRRRLKAPDGEELILALPTGTVLHPGTVLDLRGNRVYRVEAALEEVLVFRPQSLLEGMRFAHFIGNQHRDLDFRETEVLVLADVGLQDRLLKLGFPVELQKRPYLGRPISEYAHV